MLATLLLFCSDIHETAYFDGVRVGHQTIRVIAKDGKRLVSSTLDLTFRRYGETARITREEGTLEDRAVLGVFMRQAGLELIGTVDGDKLRVKSKGKERSIPWPGEVLGPVAQMSQFAERKPKPGDKWAFRRWEPTYNVVLTVLVEVKEKERIKGRELLRVELVPDVLHAGEKTIRPARSTWWLDDSFTPVRKQTSLEGLGTLVLERSDKVSALAPVKGEGPDLGKASFAKASRAIVRPYETREAMYKIRCEGVEPAGLFPSDHHQTASVGKDSVMLLVRPARAGAKGGALADDEFTASNAYIDSDDSKIAEQAKRVVGDERDPWRKSLRIERWVHNAITNDSSADLISASKALSSRRGDCRHHAFLCAALCRAAGVPSRTAIGFLYVNRGGPMFGFHAWTEVLIDGRWIGLDSTLGRGGVSAAHVKVTDHSWHKQVSLAPLLPVQRVVGKVRFEVLETK